MTKTKKKFGETVMSSSIGKSILKDIATDEMWAVMETVKHFVGKEFNEKSAKKLYNHFIKTLVKIALLSKAGLIKSLPCLTLLGTLINADWRHLLVALNQLFSMVIDAQELSFCCDPDAIVAKIVELQKLFDSVFGGKKSMFSTNS